MEITLKRLQDVEAAKPFIEMAFRAIVSWSIHSVVFKEAIGPELDPHTHLLHGVEGVPLIVWCKANDANIGPIHAALLPTPSGRQFQTGRQASMLNLLETLSRAAL